MEQIEGTLWAGIAKIELALAPHVALLSLAGVFFIDELFFDEGVGPDFHIGGTLVPMKGHSNSRASTFTTFRRSESRSRTRLQFASASSLAMGRVFGFECKVRTTPGMRTRGRCQNPDNPNQSGLIVVVAPLVILHHQSCAAGR